MNSKAKTFIHTVGTPGAVSSTLIPMAWVPHFWERVEKIDSWEGVSYSYKEKGTEIVV